MALPSQATPRPAAVPALFRRKTLADREDWLGRLMLAPAMLYVAALVGLPFALALALAFSSARSGSLDLSWVGLRHFVEIIPDPQFQRALWNTLRFTVVSQCLVMVLAVTAAHVLSATFAGRRAVRFLLLLPWAAPVALAAMAWTWIFDSTFSVVNWTFLALGLTRRWFYWCGDPTLAMIAIITVHVWRMFPFATVITLAG
ncbi:MAG: sugar ABC transporter permease, partial [Candidatus Rokubacteria bacterium]|nr:sugar ABC transporter permease [Candidatus Rokubacteria bacterium]